MFDLSLNNRFTDENIKDNIKTIVISGTETTAITTSFILIMLAMNPYIQERVFKEIKEYYVEDDTKYKYLSKLVYTDMVILKKINVLIKHHLMLHLLPLVTSN